MASNLDLDDALPIVAALYKAQASKVRRYLGFRLGNRDDAADAAQEVFLKLLRYEQSGSLRSEARNYLFSATQSAIADTKRWRAVRGYGRSGDAELGAIPAPRATPEDEFFWREALSHFVDSLKALPELSGNVFLLSYFEGMTYPQIAKTLGISERTAERHMHKALHELRKCMEDYL